MKVYQITEALSYGDAVSNDAVGIDRLLKEMKISGGIFVGNKNNIATAYRNTIARTIDELPTIEDDDIILIHHAIYNGYLDSIALLPGYKVLVYHNITPPNFFEGIDENLQNATSKGLDQLKRIRPYIDCCIADSIYNKTDLLNAGYTCEIYVCPVLIPFDDYRRIPSRRIIKKYQDDYTNILFVGRLSPNKKQEDVIRSFALYKKYYNKKSRLFLVGSDGIAEYANRLREFIQENEIEDVVITGSISFNEVIAYYKLANVFVCMSEHEGLCVPLLEAMNFGVPIIAYESTAVAETLSNGGILIKEKKFPLIAGWINRIVGDVALQDEIRKNQKIVLEKFNFESVSQQYVEIITKICKEHGKKHHEGAFDESSRKFDVIIPIKASDWENAKKNIPFIQQNIKPQRIIIISSGELKNEIDGKSIGFIDEDKMIPGMCLESVRQTLEKAGGVRKTAGWYLQQFLKLSYARICTDEYYLVWDADTFPTRPISFFDEKSGKPFFNLKREYVWQYFDTIENLLDISKTIRESFITEHMMFETKSCREMLDAFEKNPEVFGKSFWEKTLYACDFSTGEQVFSEYETYGNYMTCVHKNRYAYRKLETFRLGRDFLGDTPTREMLEWAGQDFHTVSFEHWGESIGSSEEKCRSAAYRKRHTFAETITQEIEKVNSSALVGDEKAIREAEKIKSEEKFDWFFGEEPECMEL